MITLHLDKDALNVIKNDDLFWIIITNEGVYTFFNK